MSSHLKTDECSLISAWWSTAASATVKCSKRMTVPINNFDWLYRLPEIWIHIPDIGATPSYSWAGPSSYVISGTSRTHDIGHTLRSPISGHFSSRWYRMSHWFRQSPQCLPFLFHSSCPSHSFDCPNPSTQHPLMAGISVPLSNAIFGSETAITLHFSHSLRRVKWHNKLGPLSMALKRCPARRWWNNIYYHLVMVQPENWITNTPGCTRNNSRSLLIPSRFYYWWSLAQLLSSFRQFVRSSPCPPVWCRKWHNGQRFRHTTR